jgi:hypothetical protein
VQGLPKYVLPERKRNSDGGRYSGRKLQRPGLEKNSWSRGSGGREYLQAASTTTASTNSTTSTLKSTPAGSKCKVFFTLILFSLIMIYFDGKSRMLITVPGMK